MKTLVVYFSFTGNNEKLATELQKILHSDKLCITESKRRRGFTILLDILFSRTPHIYYDVVNMKAYDYIIFVSPIWAGKIATPLKSFLLLNKEDIPLYSFITVCSGSSGQKDIIKMELTRLVGKEPATITELWINNLLPPDKKNKIKYVTPYRLAPNDLVIFAPEIEKHAELVTK